MNTSDKKTFIYLGIGVGALIAFLLVIGSDIDDSLRGIIVVLILVIAGCLIYLIHTKGVQNDSIDQESLEEITNKDYLKQIADDIHLIKIVVIAFAAVSILTTLFTLIYLANIFSHF